MSRTLPGLFILTILLLGFASLSPKWLVELCASTYLGERLSLFELFGDIDMLPQVASLLLNGH